MRVKQLSHGATRGWNGGGAAAADLVLYFGTREALACGERFEELKAMFAGAHVVGCSTGGQIRDDDVTDSEISAVALSFEATKLKIACADALSTEHSRACGEAIGRQLLGD